AVVVGVWGVGVPFGLVALVWGRVSGSVVFGLAFGIAFPIAVWITYFRLALYPLDLAMTTATYLVARRNPQSSFRVWRWCPVVWNEVIWLPLPFVGKLF